MEFERQKAILLAENLVYFSGLVLRDEEHLKHLSNRDHHFRLKNLVDEYQLQLLGREIERINRFSWEPEWTAPLMERVRTAINHIDTYMQQNQDELFFYSARIHSLKSICASFTTI